MTTVEIVDYCRKSKQAYEEMLRSCGYKDGENEKKPRFHYNYKGGFTNMNLVDYIRSAVNPIGDVEKIEETPDGICATVRLRGIRELTKQRIKAEEAMAIREVIFNDPATIVFWKDGTKTVVKCENEDFDEEKGLAMAIVKRLYGNKSNYFNKIKKWTRKK